MTPAEPAARCFIDPPPDPELRAAERALTAFRRRCASDYWTGRCIEALAGIASPDDVLADYRDGVEGNAALLQVPEQRAERIASEALERHHLRAQGAVEALRKALRFCAPGCADAAARKVCERFGLDLAPQVSTEALRVHFSAEMATERLDRWRALIEALAPARRAA